MVWGVMVVRVWRNGRIVTDRGGCRDRVVWGGCECDVVSVA